MIQHPTLRIDLNALQTNYQTLAAKAGDALCAPVVKADAYGLGVKEVVPALLASKAKWLFVATLEEGKAVRKIADSKESKVKIAVFNGPNEGEYASYEKFQLVPVCNTQAQLAQCHANKLRPIVHIDTGMNRLGLSHHEVTQDEALQALVKRSKPYYIMSHLACADSGSNPLNARQLGVFKRIQKLFEGHKFSFANSYGIYLSKAYHMDMVRPGVALYGVNPNPGATKNPMQPVVTLTAPIVQIRQLHETETVGYGGTAKLKQGSIVATVPVGYADGYMRSLGNKAVAAIGPHRAPVVGRVSMDLITLDISRVPEAYRVIGAEVELLGASILVDDLAEKAGTIGYEILTNLGKRYKRCYVPFSSGA